MINLWMGEEAILSEEKIETNAVYAQQFLYHWQRRKEK